ncbi:hypothetical protein SEA_AOKA_44 [Arthrobacter phage Aoka]|nr:hypothetical protein SEA_AOKA_44 [Arthrobacter phage Aoka]
MTARAHNPRPGVVLEIIRERETQHAVWGEQNHPAGTGPDVMLLGTLSRFSNLRDVAKVHTDIKAHAGKVTFADILVEEVFEALAEEDPAKLRAELIQVAAVAAQWAEAIDRAEAAR